jgi:hypothetical protein
MTALTLTPHTTNGMVRFPAQMLLTAEASELGLRPGFSFSRLYDDACDVGLALRSHKTGMVTTWCLSDTEKDGEGDVIRWVLVPTPEALRKNPGLRNYRLNIYND